MKRTYILKAGLIAAVVGLNLFSMQSCKVSEEIQYKPGALLWGENCSRCHNVPSPSDFSDSDWEVIGAHMRLRANLTADETEKIIEFLKMAN